MAAQIDRFLSKAGQLRARAAAQDNKALAELRREETRRFRQLLEWSLEMGLDKVSDTQRRGAFLTLRGGSEDRRTLDRWEDLARKEEAAVAAVAAEIRYVIDIWFPPLAINDRRAVHGVHGMEYSRIRDQWTGRLSEREAADLAARYGGRVLRRDGVGVELHEAAE